ncbi:MAG TPA: serine hydrolase domain-containing protein [Rhizomicrobium sp.]|jgi:CubicO group peptidase (beta-lactamase class C family)|nr:serine hydrolase domain-containing protein [Rhizomicrobium sp.]
MRLSVMALALLLAQPTCADEALQACLVRAAARLNFNGIAYLGRGAEIIEQPFGTSDESGRTPVEKTTRFNIGSAGKMFTAVAIAQLVDRGLVSWDAPIRTYLKDVKPDIGKITVRQLLAHTSGLGDYLKPENHAAIEKARTATALLPLALTDAPAFTPGSRFAYSNSGYVVLGAIIENVSHQTYAAVLERNIFARAGMNDTALDDSRAAAPMTRMSPARMLQHPAPSPLRLPFASPAGGEASTAADVARFLKALQENRLVSATSKAELFTPQAAWGGGPSYGLGFVVNPGPPLKVGHGGGAPGVNAEIALFPASGWEVVMLSNYDPPTASHLASVLERALFAENKAAACKNATNDPALGSALPTHPRL